MASAKGLSERVAIRFGTTLLANLLRGGLSFLSGVMIARGLGASQYGDISFLLGSFVAVSQLLEMGTSSAFYTLISQRRRSRTLVGLYTGWIAFQFLGPLIVIALLLPPGIVERVWLGQERGVVLLAFVASFCVSQAWGMVIQLGEAVRKTVLVQAAGVLQGLVHLTLVAAAVYWGWLSVSTVLWMLVGEYLLMVGVFGFSLARENLAERDAGHEEYRSIIREFTVYCQPLILYGWVNFLYAFTDRWLLQAFGGAEQQGYFAVSQQFTNISLIVTTSIIKVFWKEIAEARERNNHRRIQELYASVSRGIYCLSAWISCLLIPYSREILLWTFGPGYEAAWLCLAIMFLFPIHQSVGQIQGTFLYASGETGRYAKIGMLMMATSIPAAYFMLAPGSAVISGLGLGAIGLALKEVFMQVIGVNIVAHIISRINHWDYAPGHQVVVLGLLLSLTWACKWASVGILTLAGMMQGPLVVMLLGSCLYAGFSLACLVRFPRIMGLDRELIGSVRTAVMGRSRPAVA